MLKMPMLKRAEKDRRRDADDAHADVSREEQHKTYKRRCVEQKDMRSARRHTCTPDSRLLSSST